MAFLSVIILLMVVYTRRKRPFAELRESAEHMDNQMNYAVEGGGETDQVRLKCAQAITGT